MTVIRKEISIGAPRNTVWNYLSDPNLLAAWLMRNNFTAEIGSKFQFFAQSTGEWNGHLDCTLLEFDPPRRMAFTWNANTIGADTIVTIELFEHEGQTRLRLLHANFEQAIADVDRLMERHEEGWSDHLSVLKLQAEEESERSSQGSRKLDWSQFSLHVAIKADPEKLIQQWSTIHGMENFFVEMMRITSPDGLERGGDESARAGDKYIWRWHSGKSLSGTFLPNEAKNEIRFTFGESKVSVEAVPYKGGSLLRLRQYDIPDHEQARMDVFVNCRAAWVYFLTVLKIGIEKGVDSRDKTRETGSSFSTYFDPLALGVKFR